MNDGIGTKEFIIVFGILGVSLSKYLQDTKVLYVGLTLIAVGLISHAGQKIKKNWF